MGIGTRYPHIQSLLERHYPGGRVLEIGAGGAVYRDTFETYVGLDLPTSRYTTPGDLSVLADARRLPFKANSFDFAFVVGALYMMPDPETICQDVWHALKENGQFFIFDYTDATKAKDVRKHLLRLEKTSFNFWTGCELERLLFTTGFCRIRRYTQRAKHRLIALLFPSWLDRREGWLIMSGRKISPVVPKP